MAINQKSTKFVQCEEIYKSMIKPDEEPTSETKAVVTEAFVTYTDCTEGTAQVYFSLISNRIKNPEAALRKPVTRNRAKYNNLEKYDTDYDSASSMVDEAFR